MINPTLALIPSAYKASKVYSILPSNGDGDFTFTRNSFATRVNSNGLIESVGVNVPRIDYSDGNCPSLLLEPQRTNLITYSEDFSQSSWVKSNSTIVSNSIISPSGALNSDKLVESNSSSTHGINFNYSSTSDMSFSVFAKAAERTFIQLQAGGVGSTDSVFNLSNGTIFIEEANATANIEDYGNGWYRCSVSYSSSGANNPTIRLYNGGDNYQGDGTSGLYIWGAQLEQQSYATSYIPTNGSIATRIVETCNDAGNASTFNDSEGVLFAEFKVEDLANNKILELSDGSSSDRVFIRQNSGLNQISFSVISSGALSYSFNYNVTNALDYNKFALAYKSDYYRTYVNGVKESESLISSKPSPLGLSKLNFSQFDSVNNKFFGNCKDLRVYDTALTDQELQELTTL